MTEARGMWWAVSHEGRIATYGSTALSPKEHHDGCSTPVVGVNRSPEYPGSLILVTASGSRWIVDANIEHSTPGPAWRGLAVRIIQLKRKYALKERVVWKK